MGGVITGFAVIAAIIGTGYVLGRYALLGDNGREVLTKLAFHVASPCLLFETLARSDLSAAVSGSLLITALSTVVVGGIYVLVSTARGRPVAHTTVGALCAGYVNAGNLGIPVAAYVLGDASLVAPVLLFQQILVAPVALTILDLSTTRTERTVAQRILTPFRNPVVVGSLAGVAVTASGLTVPGPVLEPVKLIGGISVPAVLLAFGISLHGGSLLVPGTDRGPVLLSVALKSVGQPLAAWALGAGVFHLHGVTLFTVVVTSALPAGQNIYTYASRYGVATGLARESILLSTILAVPVLLAVAALLG